MDSQGSMQSPPRSPSKVRRVTGSTNRSTGRGVPRPVTVTEGVYNSGRRHSPTKLPHIQGARSPRTTDSLGTFPKTPRQEGERSRSKSVSSWRERVEEGSMGAEIPARLRKASGSERGDQSHGQVELPENEGDRLLTKPPEKPPHVLSGEDVFKSTKKSKKRTPAPLKKLYKETLTEDLFGSTIVHARTATPAQHKIADEKISQLTKVVSSKVKSSAMREAFRRLDHDKDGTISFPEFTALIRKEIGIPIDDNSMALILERTDANDDGRLDIHEFFKTFNLFGEEKKKRIKDIRSEDVRKEEKEIFLRKNRAELSKIMHKISYLRDNQKSMYETVRRFDVNRDGVVEYDEFKEVLRMLHCPLTDHEIKVLFAFGILDSELPVLNFDELTDLVSGDVPLVDYGDMYRDRWAKNNKIELEWYKKHHSIEPTVEVESEMEKAKKKARVKDLNEAYQMIIDKIHEKTSDFVKLYTNYGSLNPLQYFEIRDGGIPMEGFKLGLEGLNINMSDDHWSKLKKLVDKDGKEKVDLASFLTFLRSQNQYNDYNEKFDEEDRKEKTPRANIIRRKSGASLVPSELSVELGSLDSPARNDRRLNKLAESQAFNSFLDKLPLCCADEKEIRNVLTRFDKRNTGRLSYEEFKKAFSYVNADLKDKDFRVIAGKFDQACSGYIKYPEFMRHVEQRFDMDRRRIPRKTKSSASKVSSLTIGSDPELGDTRMSRKMMATRPWDMRKSPVGLAGPSPTFDPDARTAPRVSHKSGRLSMWDDIKFTTTSKEISLFNEVQTPNFITRRSASPPAKNTAVNIVPTRKSNMHASDGQRMQTMSLSTDTWYNRGRASEKERHDRTWTNLNASLHRDYNCAVKNKMSTMRSCEVNRIQTKQRQRVDYLNRCVLNEESTPAYHHSKDDAPA